MINVFISRMELFLFHLDKFLLEKTREEKEKHRNEIHTLIKKKCLSF